MDLLDISALEFPKNLVTLSLVGNRLENPDDLISKLQYLNLRVLWLNGNSVAQNEKMVEYVNTKTRIELFNSKFTKHCTEWGLKYAHYRKVADASNIENGKIYTLNLDDRNIFIIDLTLIESFTNLRSLSLKGHNPSNEDELNKFIRILQIPSLRYLYVDEEVEAVLRKAIDSQQLASSIADRVLINKHSFRRELQEGDERLDTIYKKIFRLTGCYRLASSEKLD